MLESTLKLIEITMFTCNPLVYFFYTRNLSVSLSAQIISAAQTLALHPNSKIAKENLDVFCEAWESQLCDMAILLKEISDVFEGRRGNLSPSSLEYLTPSVLPC